MKNVLARAALVICCCGTTLVWAQADGTGGGDYHGRNNINENDKGRGAVPGKADSMATDSVASIHITSKKKHPTKKTTKHSASSSSTH
jgi:hypothetical protein